MKINDTYWTWNLDFNKIMQWDHEKKKRNSFQKIILNKNFYFALCDHWFFLMNIDFFGRFFHSARSFLQNFFSIRITFFISHFCFLFQFDFCQQCRQQRVLRRFFPFVQHFSSFMATSVKWVNSWVMNFCHHYYKVDVHVKDRWIQMNIIVMMKIIDDDINECKNEREFDFQKIEK